MAQLCVKGRQECNGCGECEPDVPTCPVCGAEAWEILVDRDGDVVGCDECVRRFKAVSVSRMVCVNTVSVD